MPRSIRLGISAAILGLVAALAIRPAAGQGGLEIKQVPALKVLAVKIDPREGYAPAFGRLVQYYLGHPEARVRFPQMSIGAAPDVYAAIAFEGEANESGPVRIMELPAAQVAATVHKGDYGGLAEAVRHAITALRAQGFVDDMAAKKLRFLYPNSPDNTPPSELVTEIQIPVTRQ